MKKVVMPLLALLVALGSVIPLATPALGAEVRHLKGQGGDASWSVYDEDTGIYTDVFVYAFDGVLRQPSGITEKNCNASISISQYRYDADEYVPIKDISFWGDLLPGSMVVNRSLTGASLAASGLQGTQWDYATGIETVVVIDINVSWTGTGPMSNYSYNYHWRYPSEFVFNHGTGRTREASARGAVIYDGISVMLGAADYANITLTNEGHQGVSR